MRVFNAIVRVKRAKYQRNIFMIHRFIEAFNIQPNLQLVPNSLAIHNTLTHTRILNECMKERKRLKFIQWTWIQLTEKKRAEWLIYMELNIVMVLHKSICKWNHFQNDEANCFIRLGFCLSISMRSYIECLIVRMIEKEVKSERMIPHTKTKFNNVYSVI